MSAVAVIWFGLAAVCCGLCIYGINRAIRRSKDRQDGRTPVLTRR
jgi:cytochrome oxidase assembly protein ShyY1